MPASANMLKSSPNKWSIAPTLIQNSVATLNVFLETHSPSWNSLIHVLIFWRSKSFILFRRRSSLCSFWSGSPARPTYFPLKISSAALRTLSQSLGFNMRVKCSYSSHVNNFLYPILVLPNAITTFYPLLHMVALKLNFDPNSPGNNIWVRSLCLISSSKNLYPLSFSAYSDT